LNHRNPQFFDCCSTQNNFAKGFIAGIKGKISLIFVGIDEPQTPKFVKKHLVSQTKRVLVCNICPLIVKISKN
jgi:hypothetical protein